MAGLDSPHVETGQPQSDNSAVQWHQIDSDADLTAAMKAAAAKNEPLVLEVGAKWCVGCVILEKELAHDQEFAALANKAYFARVELGKTQLHPPEFLKSTIDSPVQMQGLPQTYVLDPAHQKVLAAFDGYPGAHQYTRALSDAFSGKKPAYQLYSEAEDSYSTAFDKHDYPAALDALNTELKAANDGFGPTSKEAFSATLAIGDMYWQTLKDPLKAEQYLLDASKIAEANPGDISAFEGSLADAKLADIYMHDGRFANLTALLQKQAKSAATPAEADEINQRIAQVNTEAAKPENQQYFGAVQKAEVADTKNDYAAEIEARKTAVDIAGAKFGPASDKMFDSMLELGNAYQKSGDVANAEKTYSAAMIIADANPSPDGLRDRRVMLYGRLEGLYEGAGDYGRAAEMYEKMKGFASDAVSGAIQKQIDRLKALQQ